MIGPDELIDTPRNVPRWEGRDLITGRETGGHRLIGVGSVIKTIQDRVLSPVEGSSLGCLSNPLVYSVLSTTTSQGIEIARCSCF